MFSCTDDSNANFFKHVMNITASMSATTDFMSKCLTTTEDTQNSLADYFASFSSLSDYALAFLMNLTGNILSMYNTFQQIMTASVTCDYVTITNKLGVLFRRLYTVTPITAVSLKPLDFTESPLYKAADEIFQGFKLSLIQKAKLSKVARDQDKVFNEIAETKANEIFVKYYRPA